MVFDSVMSEMFTIQCPKIRLFSYILNIHPVFNHEAYLKECRFTAYVMKYLEYRKPELWISLHISLIMYTAMEKPFYNYKRDKFKTHFAHGMLSIVPYLFPPFHILTQE